VWASKFTARHPNLVALELSSFKCGHDAPIYTVVEETIQDAGTPYFSFKDIDENKPTGSIRIRVETIAYFLKRYREDMVRDGAKKSKVAEQLRMYEQALRQAIAAGRSPDDVDIAAILQASGGRSESQVTPAPAASEAAMYAGAMHKK
jgi:hypothetical protein